MSIVAAAGNIAHTRSTVHAAVRTLLDNLPQSLSKTVKPGDRVLVKVNMGCSGLRNPEDGFTTHPLFAAEIIEALLDCGADVFFGDDVARAGKYVGKIWQATGMLEVAKRTGAKLVDFTASGATEVRGTLLYPRTYLITNTFLDADITINLANCRSHSGVVLSGAIKNMFGVVVGKRKELIHKLFKGDIRNFARAIADIHKVVKPEVSFLDLTNFNAGVGCGTELRPVGLMLASTDPVALDTLAAQAVGYDHLNIWTTYWGGRLGIGCCDAKQIKVHGIDWDSFKKQNLKLPYLQPDSPEGNLFDRALNLANQTVWRPRPNINQKKCAECGECSNRCPVNSVVPEPHGAFRINHSRCVDCQSCLSVCEKGAINLHFSKIIQGMRWATGRSITVQNTSIKRHNI